MNVHIKKYLRRWRFNIHLCIKYHTLNTTNTPSFHLKCLCFYDIWWDITSNWLRYYDVFFFLLVTNKKINGFTCHCMHGYNVIFIASKIPCYLSTHFWLSASCSNSQFNIQQAQKKKKNSKQRNYLLLSLCETSQVIYTNSKFPIRLGWKTKDYLPKNIFLMTFYLEFYYKSQK